MDLDNKTTGFARVRTNQMPRLHCAEPFLKGNLTSKKGKQIKHRVRLIPRQKKSHSMASNQLRIEAAVCVFGLVSTIEIKKFVIVKDWICPQASPITLVEERKIVATSSSGFTEIRSRSEADFEGSPDKFFDTNLVFEKRMKQFFGEHCCKESMIHIPKHDLGISTSGWKRYQMHQTDLESRVVHQQLIQHPSRCLNSHISGKYTSTIQDLLKITGQSSKED